MCIKKHMVIMLLLCCITPLAWAELNKYETTAMSPEKAFETGRLYRSQFKNIESRNYLKYSADNNNPEASFLYAMELSSYKPTIRTQLEAREYLLKAAELGSRRAMYQLYTNSKWLRNIDIQRWGNEYYASLIVLGRDNPSQAMYELARFYKGKSNDLYTHYLEVAIGFNHHLALMDKAINIGNGEGFFVFGGREQEVEKLYLSAANTGNIPAIRYYIGFLESKGRYKEAYKWRTIALENGDIISLAIVTKIILGNSEVYNFIDQDYVKANAYLNVYLSSAGKERMQALYDSLSLDEEILSNKINDEGKVRSNEIYNYYMNNVVFYSHDEFWDAS